MQTVAYLTTADLAGFPIYDSLTIEPLRDLSIRVESVDWRADEDWGRFAAVLPRSPWDYHLFASEFFAVLERIEASPARLFNDLEVMRWNADKHYLGELAGQGLNVVETQFGVALDAMRVDTLRRDFGGADLVLKPAVSASAEGTFRVRAGEDPAAAVVALHGREWLAQPFMPGIVEEGEFSLIYFDGVFSHALLKLVRSGDFRVQESWGGTIEPCRPEPRLLERAGETLALLPDDLLYARLDFVRDGADFALMEAELIEPSLYFSIDAQGPVRFARALAGRIGGGA